MKSSKLSIVAIVLSALTTHVAEANITTKPGVASNYFDANWILFNTDGQPYQPAAGELAEIASRYFDANGSLINNADPAHHRDMTPKKGEDQ